MTDTPLPDAVADEPLSVKLVYLALVEHDTPATQRDLKRWTRSSTRTVRRGLNTLDDAGLLQTLPSEGASHWQYDLDRSD